jgi:hypothetical protein
MDTEKFAAGFAFYRSGGRSDRLLPAEGETDLAGWIKGFCCAMADDDTEGEDPQGLRMKLRGPPLCG